MTLTLIGHNDSDLSSAYLDSIRRCEYPHHFYHARKGPLDSFIHGRDYDQRKKERPGLTLVAVPPPDCLTAYSRAGMESSGNLTIGLLTWDGQQAPWEWRSILKVSGHSEIWTPSQAACDALRMVTDIPTFCVPAVMSAPTPDPERVRERVRSYMLPDRDDRKFVYVAGHWLVELPELPEVVRQYRSAFESDERTRLVVCAPNASPELRAQCRAAGVLLLSYPMPRQDFAHLLSGADCFVSLAESVGLDLPVVEAMGRALPVVMPRLACREAYWPVGWDKLTPGESPASACLRWVVDQRDGAAELGRAGQERVVGLFSEEQVGKVISDRLAALRFLHPRPSVRP